MNGTRPRPTITLSIHPSNIGFGWVAAEGPHTPVDWGLARVEIDKNANSLRRLEMLIDRFIPDTLVFEAVHDPERPSTKRLARLRDAATALAQDKGVDVAIFSLQDVQATFAHVGAKTRTEIAQAVAHYVPPLRSRLPAERKPWQAHHHNLAIFSAMATALTHFRLSCDRLLDDLKGDTRT